ncbi:hypothetical protein ACJMK2_003467 [Sinanodonta woodiana]|uniref:CCHC-type domain-containing protein n=1 Tax=Sinanodonta woodiana TaxID=1069815 RepID=A0ABD3XYC7_SINWO
MDEQERINREIQQLEHEIKESTCRTLRIERQMTRLKFSEQNKFKRPLVTPQTLDGTTPLMDFQAHFKEKGLYLAVSLRGQAQQLLGSGAPDYDKLMDLPICYKCVEIGHFKRVCPNSKPKLSEN